jgi:flagellar biosynthesis anti-sigma factor FlgM
MVGEPMKIENDKPNPLAGQTDPLASTAPAASASAAGKTAAQTKADQLTLSPEAQLLKAAADAAASDPAVRAELVEKMRALLADGKIGTDADQLAESLIDDVLKNG